MKKRTLLAIIFIICYNCYEQHQFFFNRWRKGSKGREFASWMYQLIIESVLGLKRKGDTLQFEPCIPEGWDSFKIKYSSIDTTYQITVLQNKNQISIEIFVDEEVQSGNIISLINDGKEHFVKVIFSQSSNINNT